MKKILLRCCALALTAILSACASTPVVLRGSPPPALSDEADQRAWNEGYRAFEEGDYRKAASIFEILSKTARTPEIARRSLYAHATVRLLLAQTPEEYAEAAALWDLWSRQAGGKLPDEDPRMLTPFISRVLAPPVQSEKAEPPRKTPPPVPPANLKGMLQAREKEVESLRTKLESREREVRRLRHQLESLEEIHKKYREKKQETSTP